MQQWLTSKAYLIALPQEGVLNRRIEINMSTKSLNDNAQVDQRLGSSSTTNNDADVKETPQEENTPEEKKVDDEDAADYPPPAQAVLVMVSVLLALFLTALVSHITLLYSEA